MRVLSLLLIAVAAIAHSTVAIAQNPVPPSAQMATTTRIETEPVYGATVTFESGVRVFRPIPPTQHMIINPGGQTPLFLGVIGKTGGHGGGPSVVNQQAVVPTLPGRRGIQNIPAIAFPQ